jgi:integrase
MPKQTINDRWLNSKQIEPGDYWDKSFSGFGVRVRESGHTSFVLALRFPGDKNPTRRPLGEVGKIGLADARAKARKWLDLVGRGIDPKLEEERLRIAQERKRENSFRAVAEDFIREKLSTERRGADVIREINAEFLPAWNGRPITEIMPLDVLAIVRAAKDRGAPYQARNLLATAKRMFGWAIGQHCYGLESSPCDRLKAKDILGQKRPRKRVLSDKELRAVWKAAEKTGYPYGPLFQLLLLTGARKSEIARARWSEIDQERRVLIVPDERHKSERGHVIWLSAPAWKIIESLPRFKSGDFLFSSTSGRTPINGFSKAKDAFDKIAKVEGWTIHDLRRSMRSRLATLPIAQGVAELMIGHAQPGLVETYSPQALINDPDHSELFAKLREGWRLWANKLRDILEPAPANVVRMARA